MVPLFKYALRRFLSGSLNNQGQKGVGGDVGNSQGADDHRRLLSIFFGLPEKPAGLSSIKVL